MSSSLLAIETTGQACSVALLRDKECLEQFQVIPKLHAQQILPMVDALLSEAQVKLKQLDAIAFSRGPGSFTGIRIATSVAQGLGYAAGLPVLPVSTLAVLAQTAQRELGRDQVLPILDAHMGEVYFGCYQLGAQGMEPVVDDQIAKPEAIDLPISQQALGDWAGVGDGWQKKIALPALLRSGVALTVERLHPKAQDLAILAARDWQRGLAVEAQRAEPVYLRDKTAWRRSPKYETRK